jgi:hypothetical protein
VQHLDLSDDEAAARSRNQKANGRPLRHPAHISYTMATFNK